MGIILNSNVKVLRAKMKLALISLFVIQFLWIEVNAQYIASAQDNTQDYPGLLGRLSEIARSRVARQASDSIRCRGRQRQCTITSGTRGTYPRPRPRPSRPSRPTTSGN